MSGPSRGDRRSSNIPAGLRRAVGPFQGHYHSSGSTFLRLLPFLARPLLAFLAYRACSHHPERQIGYRSPTTTTSPVPPYQGQVPTETQGINSRLSVVNSNGKVKFSGVVGDEQT